jgi:hypothetical protein
MQWLSVRNGTSEDRNGENHIEGTFSGSDMATESVILQQTQTGSLMGDAGDACKFLVRKFSQKSLFIVCLKCIKLMYDGDVISVCLSACCISRNIHLKKKINFGNIQ